MVFLDAAAPYAACLALAVERVVALYKGLLEIRKLQVEIRKQGIPDEATKVIEEHTNTHMERGIEKVSVEIVQEFYKGKDSGRKNELTTAVQISLNKIANRIDRGYNLEVRCEPLTASEEQDEELKNAIAIVQSASANMQFLKLEGKPLLKLPEKEKPKKKDHGRKESSRETDDSE